MNSQIKQEIYIKGVKVTMPRSMLKIIFWVAQTRIHDPCNILLCKIASCMKSQKLLSIKKKVSVTQF